MKLLKTYCFLVLIALQNIFAQADTTKLREIEVLDSVVDRKMPLITVYHAEQIREVQAIQLGDVLQEFPGVYIRDYGGLGGLKTVSLRSLSAAHTQIVVDGVPMFNSMNGIVNIGNIQTEHLNSVQLYYNTKNQLFPASAYAGAGNVFLQTSAIEMPRYKKSLNTSLSYGSFDQWIGNISGAFKVNEKLALTAQLRYDQLEGAYPYKISNGQISEEGLRENSDLQAINSFLGGIYLPGKNTQLTWRAQYYQSDRGLPGAVIFYAPHFRQRLSQNQALFQLNFSQQWRTWRHRIIGYYEQSFLVYNDPDFLNTVGYLKQEYPTDNFFISYAAEGRINDILSWKAASDGLYERMSKITNGNHTLDTERWRNFSLAALYFEKRQWQMEANVQNQLYGWSGKVDSRLNPSLHVDYKPQKSNRWEARGFYKRNFRLPNFSELYFNVIGLQELLPETVDQINLGVSWQLVAKERFETIVKTDIYLNEVRDMIIAIPTQNLFIWSVRNLGRVRTKGLDVQIHNQYQNGKLTFNNTIQYSYQQAENITDSEADYYKHQIPYTPVHQLHGNLMLKYKTTSFRVTLQWIGERFFQNENLPFHRLDPYLAADISLSKEIKIVPSQKITIQAQCRNFLNQEYEIIRSFPMPGIQVLGKIIYTWNE